MIDLPDPGALRDRVDVLTPDTPTQTDAGALQGDPYSVDVTGIPARVEWKSAGTAIRAGAEEGQRAATVTMRTRMMPSDAQLDYDGHRLAITDCTYAGKRKRFQILDTYEVQ